MDRYEFKVTNEEINALIRQKRYAEAADIADQVDWSRVRSVRTLCRIADLYKVNGLYTDARTLLAAASRLAPRNQQIIFSLCELELKIGNFVTALQLYNEFERMDPENPDRFILRYKLLRAQHVGLGDQIEVLEEMLRQDYRDKWAFTLAVRLHEAGEDARCVQECETIVATFGDGPYVIRALELKKLLAGLAEEEEERLDVLKRGGSAEDLVRPEVLVAPIEPGAITDEAVQKTVADGLRDSGLIEEPAEPEEAGRPAVPGGDTRVIGPVVLPGAEVPEAGGETRTWDPAEINAAAEAAEPEEEAEEPAEPEEPEETETEEPAEPEETEGEEPAEPEETEAEEPAEPEETEGEEPAEPEEPEETEGEEPEEPAEPEEAEGEEPEEPEETGETEPAQPAPESAAGRKASRTRQILDAMSLEAGKGNIIICGEEGAGPRKLARELMDLFQKREPAFDGKIAKTEGDLLRSDNLDKAMDRLERGVLLIEHAAGMTDEGEETLVRVLTEGDRKAVVFLIDTRAGIDDLLDRYPDLREIFPIRLSVAPTGMDKVLKAAADYAASIDCSIDPDAVDALKDRIRMLREEEGSVTMDGIRAVIDEAAYYANRKGLSGVFRFLAGKKTSENEDGITVLHEKDFLHV